MDPNSPLFPPGTPQHPPPPHTHTRPRQLDGATRVEVNERRAFIKRRWAWSSRHLSLGIGAECSIVHAGLVRGRRRAAGGRHAHNLLQAPPPLHTPRKGQVHIPRESISPLP